MIFSSRSRPRSLLYRNSLSSHLLRPQQPVDLVSSLASPASLKHSSQDSSLRTAATASPCREAGALLLKACLRLCLHRDTDSQCRATASPQWASSLWAMAATECHNSRCKATVSPSRCKAMVSHSRCRATDSLSRCKDTECLSSSNSSGACLTPSSRSLMASSEHETERDY